MKCAICKNGYTNKGVSTIVLERDQMTIVFKQVPSDVCDNCGEEYISSQTNKKLFTIAEYRRDKACLVSTMVHNLAS